MPFFKEKIGSGRFLQNLLAAALLLIILGLIFLIFLKEEAENPLDYIRFIMIK